MVMVPALTVRGRAAHMVPAAQLGTRRRAAAARPPEPRRLAYLAELLSAELEDREACRRERRIRELAFPRLRHLADFDLAAEPSVDPAVLTALEAAPGSPVSPWSCAATAAPASRTC